MNIRNRLTLRFILIVAIIICLASLLIYVFSANDREEEFYNRLESKANNTAKLLIEVDEVDVNLLRRIEKDNPVSLPNEKIIVFDFRNTIVFTTDEQKVIQVDSTLLDRIRLDERVKFRQGEYEGLGFLFKGRYDRFAVIAAATDISGITKLKNLRTILIVVFTISIIFVSVSGWFFSGKALQPISHVVRQVDEISIASLNLRVDEGNEEDEIAHLAKTFNRMLARLETAFKVQKNFIANASHELRTPLTAITGQLEVTLFNARTNDEYEQVLHSVLEDIKNLNALSNNLLLLAQTNSEALDRRLKSLRIDELIWQVKDDLTKHNPSYSINIDLDQGLDDESKLTIEGDEHLIKVLLSNIIENGCKYSGNHAIEILVIPCGTGLELHFKDNGIGIAAEDLQNIFEPFFRGKNTQKIKGHGIGLSMAQGIVALHHGTMNVRSVINSGTTVQVILPSHQMSGTV